ncbi:hypothetical protein L5515_015930 [Caenorhabditis briggsae]|uniref:Uncharacterized protein n=1 Tax=Caenorhabditis briggsae TaxID=6238 RepID=A0AAE9J9E4_CAEBR|nr:hypothetical protein L5515_015930 [Caenorhabditis briggsae]
MIHVDQIFGYSIVVLAAAPLATQLAIADIRWVFFFPLYAIPAISLMMIVGHLSKSAPVQTFRKLAPISAGIGWALTWHVAERLYSESLRGSQNLLYMLFSIRPTLTWAVSCGHSYNSEYCHDLNDKMNISVTQDGNHHYPDNFWPAQEFNKFLIRHNPIPTSMPPKWRANTWYLGHPEEEFDWAIPSVPLVASHAATWLLIVYILSKHYDRLGDILFKVFITVPAVLYMTVLIGLTGLGFHFRAGTILAEYTGDLMINKDATDFWADITGTFRTSILIVDYASAFTGFVLLATSRLRSGVNGLSALILVPLLMLVPTMQTILRLGCEGHLADVQPFYKIYASTDETISFDLLPVCFASSHFGSVFSALYFAAQYLYTSLGPMLVYVTFIYQAFIDDFPMVQNSPKKCVGMIALAFFIPSIFLYMPLGTRIAAFFRYTSQTCFVEVAIFVLIFFFYGWQRLEQDVLMTSQSPARPSLVEYFTRPTSPIFTFLQFTIVPMLLFAKFVAVFDYIRMGGDVNVHVDSGVGFLPLPFYVRRFIGYMITFAPVMIMGLGAALQLFQLVHKHGLPWSDTIKPSPEWMAHASVNPNKPRVHSLAYGIYRKFVFKHISYKTAMFTLFIVETFNGIVLVVLFFLNTAATIDFNRTNRRTANEYRSLMLLIFSSLHTYALYQMRQGMQYAQINGEKLSLYIGVATMEMAMLNAYMWLYGENHRWGTDWPPIIVALGITCLRGFFIMLAIAIRAHSIEHSRPSNTREASEVDPEDLARGSADEGAENDGDEEEDDSPVIFDLAV